MKMLLSIIVLLCTVVTAWAGCPGPTALPGMCFGIRSTWTGTVLGKDYTCTGWQVRPGTSIDGSIIYCGRYRINYTTWAFRRNGPLDPTLDTDGSVWRRGKLRQPCPLVGVDMLGDFEFITEPVPRPPPGIIEPPRVPEYLEITGLVQTLTAGASCRWLTASRVPPAIVLRRVDEPVYCTRKPKQNRWHCSATRTP
jgi:hypothetical protein